MSDLMTFPKTVEEFMEAYKIVDTEEVYTNGAELVPIFRMKQWFEAHEAIPVKWLEDYQIREFIKADPSSVDFQRACGIGCAIAAWRRENE